MLAAKKVFMLSVIAFFPAKDVKILSEKHYIDNTCKYKYFKV